MGLLLYVLGDIEDIVRSQKLRAVKNYRTPKPSANVQTPKDIVAEIKKPHRMRLFFKN